MTKRRIPPFRTSYRVSHRTLVIDLGDTRKVLSSAPHGGGLRTTRYILNHQVETNPVTQDRSPSTQTPRCDRWGDPARYLRRLAATLGADRNSVGLMTAVPMTQLVTGREETDGIWVECFATVGVTNAVRAGECPPSHQNVSGAKQVGTINLIVITNACLADSAMVGAVQVATESKTGVLRDHAVPCATGLSGATGTGTDAVVVASARHGNGRPLRYSGTHTTIGAMIGLVVARCVTEGLARARRWNVLAAERLRKKAK